MFPENKDICLVSILLQVLFCICYGVSVNINNLDDVHEGPDTIMTCAYTRDSSTSSSDPIVTWNKIIDGVADKISATQSGSTIIEPSYQDRFDVDRDDDRILVITNSLKNDSGIYQCEVVILDDPPVDDDTVTLNVILRNDCSNHACSNGGVCTPSSSSTGYTCSCAACFFGQFCRYAITGGSSPCSNDVCQNGGICTGFSCTFSPCICSLQHVLVDHSVKLC
ncbi:uncharacterized protein [Antedon mediterranea]|uniref:uncharacterized protein n=1 Tax=Antedon mediterranea TaxID=105859 RepID=UPI003AF82A17